MSMALLKVFRMSSLDKFDPKVLDASWISRALVLSEEAGWNQNAADWRVFFTRGTVFGFAFEERLIATAAVLPYGAAFGWLSMVLVASDWRARGLATRLVSACASLLQNSGRAALLDAAPGATGIYAKLGFLQLCPMERWEGYGGAAGGTSGSANIEIAIELDCAAFGADRRFLLKDFLSRRDTLTLRSPNGFAILRHGLVASQLGPMVAEPGEAPALAAAAIGAAGGRVFVDVLGEHNAIVPVLVSHGFCPQRRFTRMALGLSTLPGNPARLIAAAGPEFG
ncbi:MAG: GNAT family N-acetyltransferase [Acidobacteriaceae bacterium]